MAKRKILVVDDDADLRRLMSLVLQMGGYDVISAADGVEALNKVRQEAPNLVLLDIMMPEMDGFETCRRLRKLPEGANIPVIMLSAADQVADKVKGLKVGANGYITKPADSRELIARIEAQLRPTFARSARIIAVLGSKSGVGATTLAIGLALALRQVTAGDVILFDWRLPMGDVAAALGLDVRMSLDKVSSPIDDLDAQAVKQLLVNHVSGIQVLIGGYNLEGSSLSPNAFEAAVDVTSRLADYLVVDAGCLSDPRWLQPLEIVDELLFVFTPELPALRRAALYLEMERRKPLFGERLHLIINRANLNGGIPNREIEDLLQTRIRARLPEDPDAVIAATNQGTSVIQSAPRSALAQAIGRLAQEVVAAAQKAAQP